MLSKELEQTLNVAFKEAREKRHEFMTVEHLLLALLDNNAATKVLRACGADLDKLREELTRYLDESTPMLSPKDETFNNHFPYEDQEMSVQLSMKINKFLNLYDGVHVLLMDRREVQNKVFIPARIHERNDGLTEDHFPNHFHHNWRYVKPE